MRKGLGKIVNTYLPKAILDRLEVVITHLNEKPYHFYRRAIIKEIERQERKMIKEA